MAAIAKEIRSAALTTAIAFIRRLRHGPLKALAPAWHTLGRLYRLLYRVLGLRRTVSTRIGPYGPFRLNGIFAFSDFEGWGGGHNDCFALCIEACRGKSCMIDVGAHIGLVALPAASVLDPKGRAFCFEPAMANNRLLTEHAALNDCRIEVIPCVVGAEPDSAVSFFEMDEPTGMNAIANHQHRDGYREMQRRQVSLDSFCAERDISPEVIKIDVEGAEINVLRGARATLSRCRPAVFLSVHPREIVEMGESVATLSALIDELGYEVRDARGQRPAEFGLREYVLAPRA